MRLWRFCREGEIGFPWPVLYRLIQTSCCALYLGRNHGSVRDVREDREEERKTWAADAVRGGKEISLVNSKFT